MSNSIKQTPGYIVSTEVLNKKGRFTLSEVVESVKQRLESMFETFDTLCSYVQNKINAMCELGLIGKTEIYYFSN